MASTLTREPAVAGMFYPGDPRQLDRDLDEFFVNQTAARERWNAALVPHAGWAYSGHIAAAALAQCEVPDSVIVFCPKHHPGGSQWAVAPYGHWQLPGSQVAGDPSLANQIAAAVDGLEVDPLPHAQEHAIEVQLPLLARQNPNVRAVGITIGRADYENCLRIADGLAQVMQTLESPPLLVISSDMNHFATDQENRRLDSMAIDALAKCNPKLLYDTCIRNNITMCGMRPAVIVLETLQRLNRLHECKKVAYTTSADASGDFSRVVGYAGMLFR
jgi:AmmeMemoRadiSam system protein B